MNVLSFFACSCIFGIFLHLGLSFLICVVIFVACVCHFLPFLFCCHLCHFIVILERGNGKKNL